MTSMALRVLRSAWPRLPPHTKTIHTTSALLDFLEQKRSQYPVKYDLPPEPDTKNIFKKIANGFKYCKGEIKKLLRERKERDVNYGVPIKGYETTIVWQFHADPSVRREWIVTCDSDYNQGYSTARLDITPEGTGVFWGNLSTKVPQDGKLKAAGYCNITTVTRYRSFLRFYTYNWYPNTHLVLRVRGDGRPYSVNLNCKGYYDLSWNDCFHFPLYTAGGPYWQIVKIPFSKFVFASKGVIQDKQSIFEDYRVTHFGITIADKVDGPFRLEIDYIGVEYDPNHTEITAYEMYHHDDVKM